MLEAVEIFFQLALTKGRRYPWSGHAVEWLEIGLMERTEF